VAKKKTLAQRIAGDPKLKAKYLNNPGLRSKLPDSALTPALRKQRAANTYAKTPITPGSGVTNAMLAKETAAAQTVRYGQAEQALQQQALGTAQLVRNEQDWYGSYQRELAQHAQNTQMINAQANAANLALQQGITGIGQQQSGQLQQGANADAASRGTTAASLAPEATAALGVRQQMAQGLGAQQVATGAANAQYAGALAGVVAPAQRLSALQQSGRDFQGILKQGQGLAREKGAYGEQYKSERTADEFKNVLAQQTLGLDTAKATADQAAKAAALEERKIARRTTDRNVDASRAIQQSSATSRQSIAEQRLELERERVAIAKGKAAKGKPVKPATREAHARTKGNIDTARLWIEKLQKTKGKNGKPLTSAQIRSTLLSGQSGKNKAGETVKIPALPKDAINAAYDLVVNGELSPANVRALHNAGISIRQLGYPTTGSRRKRAGRSKLKRTASDIDQLRKSLRP
jgi:hypothetical protein